MAGAHGLSFPDDGPPAWLALSQTLAMHSGLAFPRPCVLAWPGNRSLHDLHDTAFFYRWATGCHARQLMLPTFAGLVLSHRGGNPGVRNVIRFCHRFHHLVGKAARRRLLAALSDQARQHPATPREPCAGSDGETPERS